MSWNIDVPHTQFVGPSLQLIRDTPDNIWRDPIGALSPTESEAFASFLKELSDQQEIAIDTETTGLNTWRDIPLYASMAWGTKRAVMHASLLPWMQPVLSDRSKDWIMANAKYDTHMLSNVRLFNAGADAHPYGNLVDTCVMHALLYEEQPHGLKYMCQHIGGWSWGDFQDQFGKIGKSQSPAQLLRKAELEDFPRLVEYAGNDAWGTLLVYKRLKEQLQHAPTHSLFRDKPPYIETLWDLFSKVEVPYTRCLWRMERHGIKVDRTKLEKARPEAEAHLQKLQRKLNFAAGRVVNINSTQQLRKWLIDERKLTPLKRTKGGKTGKREASTDAGFLQHHADRGDEACALILEYREYNKLLGTYINGLHGLLDPFDRIHTRFNQDVARTGRLSSSEPNLQNIPRSENDHWNLRGSFIPEDGYDLLCYDYSQLEMRLLAAAALEQSMIDMIHSGKDIHMGNAELVFGLPYDDIVGAKTKKESKIELTPYDTECLSARAAVKSIGFGILYGMGSAKLANTLGITQREAEAKIEQFLKAYPAVKAFTQEAIEETRRTGYAFTVLGRRRNIPQIASLRMKERSQGERLAVNTQIQGSAADVVKMAQIMYDRLGYERQYGCRMLLQVHDELVFECPKEYTAFMGAEIEDVMRHPFVESLAVMLDVDGGSGASWGEAK